MILDAEATVGYLEEILYVQILIEGKIGYYHFYNLMDKSGGKLAAQLSARHKDITAPTGEKRTADRV